MNETIIKRLSQQWGNPPLKGLPPVGSKWKFSGEEMPLGTIKHVEERTGTVVFKVPGYSVWDGRNLPRSYVPAETIILRHLGEGKFELLAAYGK